MDSNFPEFKKIDKVIDGELCEKFFIDDVEVSESTYYTLLEDRIGINIGINNNNLNKSNNKNNNNKNNSNNNKSNLKQNTIKTETNLPNEEYTEDKDEYINSLIKAMEDNPEDEFDILYDELVYHYKLGYFMGQLDLNDNYAKAMRQNYRVIQDKIDDLTDEYEKY
jgi:hypothetical protein